jgi:hypothetical protein
VVGVVAAPTPAPAAAPALAALPVEGHSAAPDAPGTTLLELLLLVLLVRVGAGARGKGGPSRATHRTGSTSDTAGRDATQAKLSCHTCS